MSIGYLFEASIPFSCRDTGKFESPSDNWQHEALPLDDTFEKLLIIFDMDIIIAPVIFTGFTSILHVIFKKQNWRILIFLFSICQDRFLFQSKES